ncbi:MAG: hypothetical protein WBP12_01420 [Candidatus Saccharimonas sp.]
MHLVYRKYSLLECPDERGMGERTIRLLSIVHLLEIRSAEAACVLLEAGLVVASIRFGCAAHEDAGEQRHGGQRNEQG